MAWFVIGILALLLAGFLMVAIFLTTLYWLLRSLVLLLLRMAYCVLKLILPFLRIAYWVPKSLILFTLSILRARATRKKAEQAALREDRSLREDYAAEEYR